jgi:hypothetical protein
MCSNELSAPLYQCIDDHVVCHICLHASERGYCPICRQSGKNRRPKRHDKISSLKTSKSDDSATDASMDVDEPKTETETDEKPIKTDVDTEPVAEQPLPEPVALVPAAVAAELPVAAAAPVAEAAPVAVATAAAVKDGAPPKNRKRRGKNDGPHDGETKEKTKKVSGPPKQKRPSKAEKKLLEAKAKAEAEPSAETKIDENAQPPKLETLFAAGPASNLPKSVLLPTAPIVQNLLPKSPQPQVAAVQAFQLRPTTGNLQILTASPGTPPQLRMQASSPTHPSLRPQGLQVSML